MNFNKLFRLFGLILSIVSIIMWVHFINNEMRIEMWIAVSFIWIGILISRSYNDESKNKQSNID